MAGLVGSAAAGSIRSSSPSLQEPPQRLRDFPARSVIAQYRSTVPLAVARPEMSVESHVFVSDPQRLISPSQFARMELAASGGVTPSALFLSWMHSRFLMFPMS